MTSPKVVVEMLSTLLDAGLDFTPKKFDNLTDVWVKVFSDVPDDIFTQAVADYLMIETKWPAPAKIRAVAEKVKAHNGQSVAPSAFVDNSRKWKSAPEWVRKEGDRLEQEIGYLLKKRRCDWTSQDITNYEQAIGAKLDSPEETTFWATRFESAYYLDHMEPLQVPDVHSWEDAQAWQEGQRVTV